MHTWLLKNTMASCVLAVFLTNYSKRISYTAGFTAFALTVWESWFSSFGIWVLRGFFLVIVTFVLVNVQVPWYFTILVDDFIVLMKDSGQRDSWRCLDKGLWFRALPWVFVWLFWWTEEHTAEVSLSPALMGWNKVVKSGIFLWNLVVKRSHKHHMN